ncbi:TolC family protein [Parahaliea mediterranea]|uniref:TolC family protein n=2 Tax=Parahaliea mediterranea TaxID=651086 RepID=A0A939DE74_9GAMM|nr:TolC family protein [Parahaliea mediterranea]
MVRATLAAGVLLLAGAPASLAAEGLNLREAVALARQQDPWLEGSRLRQEALAASGVAAGSLPDPVISLGAANLPTNTFDFNQEPMTQLKVGLMQTLPRGDSLALDQRRYEVLGEQQAHLRADRREQVALTVAELWLEAYRAQRSVQLIQADRGLFEYLVDVARSSYSSAAGSARQQDVIRAQLELTRLDERIARLREGRDTALARLGEWLGASPVIDDASPAIPLRGADQVRAGTDSEWLGRILGEHPAVTGIEQTIAAGEVDVELARQKYKPQWGLNASYGYREDDPMGMERADFFSVGVSFDLPLFTGRRQDRELQSATARAEASRTDRALALRGLRGGFETERARLFQLESRLDLYSERLLRQMHEQAEAALAAYTADDGDFAEVVRARIDELNARVEALDIHVERQRTIARLNYYLAGLDTAPAGEEQP